MPDLISVTNTENNGEEFRRLSQDNLDRAKKEVRLVGDGKDDEFVLSDKYYQEQLTKRIFSDNSSLFTPDLEICEVCFEPQHGSWASCGPNDPPYPSIMTPNEQRVEKTISMSTIIDREGDQLGEIDYSYNKSCTINQNLWVEERIRQEELERLVSDALRPAIHELIATPTTEKIAWGEVEKSTRKAREAFEELERMFEARRAAEERAAIALMNREVGYVVLVFKERARLTKISLAESEIRAEASLALSLTDRISVAETLAAETLASITGVRAELTPASALVTHEQSRSFIPAGGKSIGGHQWTPLAAGLRCSAMAHYDLTSVSGDLRRPSSAFTPFCHLSTGFH
jgi:hypothetical protein